MIRDLTQTPVDTQPKEEQQKPHTPVELKNTPPVSHHPFFNTDATAVEEEKKRLAELPINQDPCVLL